jgi:outer membrane protein TolC
MDRWFLLAASVGIVATLGCASTPKPAERAGTAYTPRNGIKAASPAHQRVEPTRLPLPHTGGSQFNSILPASHVSEAGNNPPGWLFGPDAPLDELIAFALANNPEIQAVHMQAHALAARVPQVRALDDPKLMTTTFLEPIQTAAGPQDVILSISQTLPWFGKRALRGNVAYHKAQATFALIAAAELTAVEQVKIAYYELYFLDRAIDVNKELELRLRDVIEIAKLKYETAGEKTGLETVLQAQVELAQLQTVFVQLEQAKASANAQLTKALHAPPGVPLELAPSIREGHVPNSADVLLALIDQCQPKLDALRREMNSDQAAIALANKNYYPDVMVGFNWHAIGTTGLSPLATGEDAYALMVGVNLPIYRYKLNAGLREAEFKAAQTSQMYAAAWNDVHAEVHTLHAQAVEHDRVVKILNDDILPKSRQTLDLSIEAYRVDRITFQQLIDNYKTFLHHRLDYYRRLSHLEQTLATLERAVGCAITTWPVELEEIPAGVMTYDP